MVLDRIWERGYTTVMIVTFVKPTRNHVMSTVSATEAGRIVGGKPRETVRRWIHQGLLSAEIVGLRRDFRVDLDDLRRFANQYNYPFNEELAAQLAKD